MDTSLSPNFVDTLNKFPVSGSIQLCEDGWNELRVRLPRLFDKCHSR